MLAERVIHSEQEELGPSLQLREQLGGVGGWACEKFVGREISSRLGIPKTLPSVH
jgi:hypothetical protein